MKLNPDELSPITGNLCVFVEWDDNVKEFTKLCMESGYHTYDSWKDGSESVQRFSNQSPNFINESAIVDESGQVWFKITMLTDSTILCSEEDGWKVNSFRNLLPDESPGDKIQRISKNILGEEIIQILDENWATNFTKEEFEKATIEFFKRATNANIN